METLKRVETLYKVIGDYTRLRILSSLLDDSKCECDCNECGKCIHLHCMIEKCVNDIVEDINASQSLVSHQLSVLKREDIVSTRRDKNKIYYRLKDGHIKQLLKVAIDHVKEEKEND